MQQPVASDSDGEFPEEAASPGMRKARRRIGRQKEEIHALRRLVCGGWMAQWRMLCELGEDPVPPWTTTLSDALARELEDEEDYDLEFSGGARVDPAALAGALRGGHLGARRGDGAARGRRGAGRRGGALRVGAGRDACSRWSARRGVCEHSRPSRSRPGRRRSFEQLDAAYGRLEDMSSRRGDPPRAARRRRGGRRTARTRRRG